MRSRVLAGLGILVIAATSALVAFSLLDAARSGGSGQEAEAPTKLSLAAELVAQLQLPSSTKFSAGGHDAYWTMESGSTPAIAWRRYGVDASWDEIVAYFDSELKASGWRDGGCSGGLTSTEEWDVEAWHSDDRILRLGNRRDGPTDAVLVGTYYSVALIGEGVPPGCVHSDERASQPASPSP